MMKCKVCEYGELYNELEFGNEKFPITAAAAEHFRTKCIEKGLPGTDRSQIILVISMIERGCVNCEYRKEIKE